MRTSTAPGANAAAEPLSSAPPTLERLLRPIAEPERIGWGARTGPQTWMTGSDGWRVLACPRDAGSREVKDEIERFALPSGRSLSAVLTADGEVVLPFDPNEALATYLTEAWRNETPVRQLSSRQLQIYYRVKRLLPRAFWLAVRRSYIRARRRPAFPAWPLEPGVDRLARFYALCLLRAADRAEAPFLWFWPFGHRAALTLTHDIESEAGLRPAVELADLEQERGFRSSFNIVGDDYPIDHGILRELRDRGFEIGLHGLRHDRSLFSSRAEFERQLPRLAAAAESLGATGFRSPSTHRVVDWLGELPVSYDCTVPHSDPYEPQPGGCCSLWPFLLDRVVELPYTLPQDHLLFTLLRERSCETWLTQADAIEQRFGLIQCLSHPDPGYLADPQKRAIYGDFLDRMVDREHLWKALPSEIADWWRRRDAGVTEAPEQLLGTVAAASSTDYAIFKPPAAADRQPASGDSIGSTHLSSRQRTAAL
jgi:peptidoglycan/xylan/chitin deacetylase (PgdA/CDA1 family)